MKEEEFDIEKAKKEFNWFELSMYWVALGIGILTLKLMGVALSK